MTSDLLLYTGNLKIGIGDGQMSSHLVQSLRRNDINAQLGLSFGKPQPELTPGRMPRPLAEERRHLSTIAAGKRRLVCIIWTLLGGLSLELLDLLLQLLDLGLDGLVLFSHVGD
jgi:hypothetical protein